MAACLASGWIVAGTLGVGNILVVYFLIMNASLRRSPWVLHYDASSCNGCDIEVLASLTPMYDVERLGS